MVIWNYNANGTLNTAFGNNGIVIHNNAAGGNDNDEGNFIVLDTSGNIIVTGYSKNSSGNKDMIIWRYKSDGTLDTTFGTGGIVVHNSAAGGNSDDEGNSVVLDTAGNIIVAGLTTSTLDGGFNDMIIWYYK